MVAFLALLAKPAIAGLIKWGIGAAVTYFVASKGIEAFGSTPAKRGADWGIIAEDAINYANKNSKDKLKHAKEKAEEHNQELKDENEKLKEDLKKLEQRLLKETEDWKDPNIDSTERARRLAIMQATEAEIKEKRKQKKDNEATIKKNEKEVLDMYDELSAGAKQLTVEQLKDKNSRPDLGYWSTWIILTIAVITAVLIVKFIFGMFKKFNKEI